MSVHLQRQIKKLRQMVVDLSGRVEDAVRLSIEAVESHDPALAQKVVAGDDDIDRIEVEVEEECLHTLALYQPLAFDLRYVVAVLKINSDLERIADMAVNIAENAEFLARQPKVETPPFDLTAMADRVRRMLHLALQAMLDCDTVIAESVTTLDDEIDNRHRSMYERVEQEMRRTPEAIPQLARYTSISRQLERIADLATNIAEDVIYTARGDIQRHTGK